MITNDILLLYSNDIHIANITRHKLKYSISNVAGDNNVISVNDFLSDHITNGLY